MAHHGKTYQSAGLTSLYGNLFVSRYCHLRIFMQIYGLFGIVKNHFYNSFLLLTIEGVRETLSNLSKHWNLEITAMEYSKQIERDGL